MQTIDTTLSDPAMEDALYEITSMRLRATNRLDSFSYYLFR